MTIYDIYNIYDIYLYGGLIFGAVSSIILTVLIYFMNVNYNNKQKLINPSHKTKNLTNLHEALILGFIIGCIFWYILPVISPLLIFFVLTGGLKLI